MSTIMYKDIEYGGSGGGGTEVIPNPAGQPLADLNKLQINNDIYRIPSGGSGSDVSITPTLAEGTKIADFEIDGVEGELYAPAGGGGSDVSITPSLAAGVKIADFEIDGDEGELFVPDSSKIYIRYTKPADSLGENGDLTVIISPDFTYELIDEMGGWELDSYSINNDGSYNFTFTGLTDTSASEDNSVVIKINGFGGTGSYNVKCKIKFEGNMGGAWNQALGPALFASPAQSANGYNISQAQAGTFIRIGGDDGGIINIDWDQDWHNYDYNFDYHSSNNNLYIRLATARNYIYNQTDPATMYVENFLISGDTSTVPKVSEAYSKVDGHWIEVELGGGASAISDLTDVQFTNLSDGQILKYDSTSQKWINVAEDTDYVNLTNKPSINSVTLSGNKTSSDLGIVVTLTQVQYDALTTEEKNDPNKVYYVTDAPSGGGVTELSELNDVNVNSITDGQVLKYDATNHVWVNDDESGGTTVVANPSGSAIADLNKVQIGETIYNIAGSGGSGGGITALDTTERTTWNTLFTLSDAITNYDAILVNMYYTNGQGYPMTGSIVLPITELADHSYRTWIDGGNNDRALEIEFTDSTHYQIIAGNSDNGIHGVYGLKFGGGSSGGGGITTETTELFNSALSTIGTYTLNDDYENYDFLTIIGGISSDEQYSCKEVRCYSVAGLKEFFDANSNNNVIFSGYAYRNFRFRIDNDTFTIIDNGDGQGLYTIYGHKFKGGGTGSGYTRTSLWSGMQYSNAEITLDDDIDNYDALEFVTKLSNGAYNTVVVDAKSFSTDYPYTSSVSENVPHYCLLGYSTCFARVITGSTTSSLYAWDFNSLYLVEVNGIKYGGGSSSSQETYSTTEQVVGTWIDGKPVYQKTFQTNFSANATDWINTGVTIADLETIVDLKISGTDSYTGTTVPAYLNAPYNRYYNNNIQIYLFYIVWAGATMTSVTVRYTKTTD